MKSGSRGFVLRMVISVAAILLIAYFLRDKLDNTVAILRSEVSGGWLVLAVAVYLSALAIQSVRLQLVLKVQEIHLKYSDAFYLNFLGLFFNLFFPSAVGGDVARAYYCYKHSGKKLESTTAVILDRLMGFVALILMALVAVLVYSRNLNDDRIDHAIYGALAIMFFTLFFFASKRFARLFKGFVRLVPSKKWRQRISDLYHAIYYYKKHHGVLMSSILLSLMGQLFFVMVHYCVARGLGVQLTPWIFFILIPLVTFVSMAPSIGGIGVREAGVVYFFSRYMPSERALAMSLLLDMIIYGYSLVSGIIFSLKGGLKSKEMHEMEELE